MDILLALVPALMWGMMPLIATHFGGTQHRQTLGVTLGALVLAIIIFLVKQPVMTSYIFWIGIASGICWAIGQINQFAAIHRLGVSKAMPLSTSMQLIFTALLGVLVLGEWSSSYARIIGGIALLLIVLGAIATSIKDKTAVSETAGESTSDMLTGIIRLLISTAGYVAYVLIPRLGHVEGDGVWGLLLPQAIGMVGGALIMSLAHKPLSRDTALNVIPGLVWAVGNVTMMLAVARIGTAIGFSLSQANLAIATLGGIFILKESKTSRELVFSLVGVALVIAGAIMIGTIPKDGSDASAKKPAITTTVDTSATAAPQATDTLPAQNAQQ
ncbi:GRP family sugar transporter [Zymobacter sp. IVIA_12111.31 C1]|uniref:GRP family sugar transporter n=1 Tax=Zymobacter sp. IVIA_12111.31 C1 TaxID=3394854 RepID=UPI0039C411B5